MKRLYMRKLALINILKKGKRTRLSLVATVLSTAIIFCACILFKNVSELHSKQQHSLSSYHYAVMTLDEIELSSRYRVSVEYDTQKHMIYQEDIYQLHTLDVHDGVMPFVLKEGRLPQQSNEILVSEKLELNINDMLDQYNIVGKYKEDELFNDIHLNEKIVYTKNLEGDIYATYILDNQVYHSSSFSSLVSKLNISSSDVYTNDQLVSVDTIRTYMKDTSLIRIFFIIIIILCIMMSLISIHNVLLISDSSRKKEIGLLKSIGASSIDVKVMLKTELFILGCIGALLGLGLGIVISYFILMQFIETLYIPFELEMIFSPIILFTSFIVGVLFMYVSGMIAYKKYFKSLPIDDLKETHYDFMPPTKTKPVLATGFGWVMFCIYNRRMKKQTHNIQISFMLLVITSIMFLAVVFSTTAFKNQNTDKPYDFEIKNFSTCQPEVSYQIRDLVKDDSLGISDFEVTRTLHMGFRTNPASYDDWYGELDAYKAESNIIYYEATDKIGDRWVNIFHYPTVFDQYDLELLRPYVVEGSLENLSDREVIAVFRDSFLGAQFCDNFKVGDIVAYYNWYDDSSPTAPKTKDMAMKKEFGRRLSAIVILPETVAQNLGYPYNEYDRLMGFSLDVASYNVRLENFTFSLKNAGNSVDVEERIHELLIATGAQEMYQVTNIALEIENNRFSSFIMQVLLYPLFMMLFIVSLMNIHNVLSGNLLLKQNDIAIMRLVGIGNKQLRLMLVYEYIEGYIRACLETTLLFIPQIYLENKVGVLSSFQLADHMFGALIFSIAFMGVGLLIPIVSYNIKRFQKIQALDALHEF